MEVLCLEGTKRNEGNGYNITIPSAISFYLWQYCRTNRFQILLLQPSQESEHAAARSKCCFPCSGEVFNTSSPKDVDTFEACAAKCRLPVIVVNNGTRVIAGLGAVLRKIVKASHSENPDRCLEDLLGFRQICLKACAEVSTWTRFCEVDMPGLVERIYSDCSQVFENIPEELLKLEKQFSQPVVKANVNKMRKELKKTPKTSEESRNQEATPPVDSNSFHQGVQGDSLNKDVTRKCAVDSKSSIQHTYVEGADFTLTDIVVFFCLSLILNHGGKSVEDQLTQLRKTVEWYIMVAGNADLLASLKTLGLSWPTEKDLKDLLKKQATVIHKENVTKSSVNSSQVTSIVTVTAVKEQKKKFKATGVEVTRVLDYVYEHSISVCPSLHPVADVKLPWQDMPDAVHPKDGELPKKRLERKCQQLENLAAAVRHIAKPGDTIVDFCSGGGHLGILLAYLCTDCKVILVENKEESIQKAETRIAKLQLENIAIYQCNLDYFHGAFDIGVCLHACGVATDLVLQSCLDNHASFVICPCCYGNIKNTHSMTYPRSPEFREMELAYKDYLVLGHAADQTQVGIQAAPLGKRAMEYVDGDRASLAVQHGYSVTLCTLSPPTCSPKNNLLIGTKSCTC